MEKIKSKLKKYLCLFTLLAFVLLPAAFSVEAQTKLKIISSKKVGGSPKSRKKKAKIKQKMNQTNTSPVAFGIWGANGIALTVGENGAQIEYDCATGEITQKLTIDARGNFIANGTHTLESFGPVQIGSEPAAKPARYEGNISGDKMTLKVTLTESREIVGEYTLESGKTPRLHKCL